ncbi:MAG: DUF1778 domain-containing protein [Chloroflexia bacterium]
MAQNSKVRRRKGGRYLGLRMGVAKAEERTIRLAAVLENQTVTEFAMSALMAHAAQTLERSGMSYPVHELGGKTRQPEE